MNPTAVQSAKIPWRGVAKWAARLTILVTTAGCSAPAAAPTVKRAVRVTALARRDLDTATRYTAALEPRERST